MTDQERQEAIDKAIKERKATIRARKEAEIKEGFLNPLGECTTHEEFMSEVTKSKKSVAEYCKGKLTKEEIAWIELELEHFTNNKNE